MKVSVLTGSWDAAELGISSSRGAQLHTSPPERQQRLDAATDQQLQAYLMRTDMPWLGLL